MTDLLTHYVVTVSPDWQEIVRGSLKSILKVVEKVIRFSGRRNFSKNWILCQPRERIKYKRSTGLGLRELYGYCQVGEDLSHIPLPAGPCTFSHRDLFFFFLHVRLMFSILAGERVYNYYFHNISLVVMCKDRMPFILAR